MGYYTSIHRADSYVWCKVEKRRLALPIICCVCFELIPDGHPCFGIIYRWEVYLGHTSCDPVPELTRVYAKLKAYAEALCE